jgi:hypothetical protein
VQEPGAQGQEQERQEREESPVHGEGPWPAGSRVGKDLAW